MTARMDIDLFSEISTDHQPALSGALLFNLPNIPLTPGLGRKSVEEDAPDCGLPARNPGRENHNQAGAVISKIEDIFESITDSILKQKPELIIRLKTRKKTSSQIPETRKSDARDVHDDGMRAVKFPSRSPQEAWKFSKSATAIA
jgi:meiotic recombination protein SPO11